MEGKDRMSLNDLVEFFDKDLLIGILCTEKHQPTQTQNLQQEQQPQQDQKEQKEQQTYERIEHEQQPHGLERPTLWRKFQRSWQRVKGFFHKLKPQWKSIRQETAEEIMNLPSGDSSATLVVEEKPKRKKWFRFRTEPNVIV